MNLSKDLELLFRKVLLQSVCDSAISLPDNWEIGKVYKSIYYKYGHKGGRDFRFFISENEEGNYFLDYFLITDDYSSHMRINQEGKAIKLENYEGQFGWPVLASEEETERAHNRIRLHNHNVQSILISKGLEEERKT